jgi:hypothetical protein
MNNPTTTARYMTLMIGTWFAAWQNLLLCFGLSVAWAGDTEGKTPDVAKLGIQYVDLIHFSHTDIGFTDQPAVTRELQKRYLDIAIDAILATRNKPDSEKFYWTAEATISVDDWWQSASPERRKDFLGAVKSGQLCISAIAMNNTPFLDKQEWHKMLHWLPEDLWQQVHPTVALQDDVNGMPRAGAMQMLDRGIHRLFMGMNDPGMGPPMKRPTPFWWKMPDGRRVFVYYGFPYPTGNGLLNPGWRRGPVPMAGDTRYRPPRAGDLFASDEVSVRKANELFRTHLANIEAGGYHYPRLLLSVTNEWRMDNDPPLLALAEFVGTWNRLGLKPELRFTTAAVAMEQLEKEIGLKAPEYQGEWSDWWAYGTASGPREVAASRQAKRLLDDAHSPLWGPWNESGLRTVNELVRSLCLFDEHTWGSSNSVGLPYALDTQAQFCEKASLAFLPMARAQWLLSQRVRTKLINAEEGLCVANSTPESWSGWLKMPSSSLRDSYHSLKDSKTGKKQKLYFEKGYRLWSAPANPEELTRENTAATFPDHCEGQTVKFWIDNLPGNRIRRFQWSTEDVSENPSSAVPGPKVDVDAHGWPTAITWPGMTKPLFLPGFGDFTAIEAKGLSPRWSAMFFNAKPDQRVQIEKDTFYEVKATTNEATTVVDNPHTIVFTQSIDHPRLRWAIRELEIWKDQPRAKYRLKFDRISSEKPEYLFVSFAMPCESTMPETSCGGTSFVPIRDQLPGTCRDYYGIDGWVHYAAPEGHWLWVTRDAPLVSFNQPPALVGTPKDSPEGMNRVLAMLFDNSWLTNFVADEHGVMDFTFDLAWRKKLPASTSVADLARTLASEPQVIIHPKSKESPIVIQRLYTP